MARPKGTGGGKKAADTFNITVTRTKKDERKRIGKITIPTTPIDQAEAVIKRLLKEALETRKDVSEVRGMIVCFVPAK